ncbi:MAG TPA: formyltransferase family protein [Chitinophagaceae bacterium]|nr:formyltransferase family protein [Chitinophagaceae bacterium]
MNILYLGSKKIGCECLRELLSIAAEEGAALKGILTNPQAAYAREITALAGERSIPVFAELDEILQLKDIDLLVSVQYHRILRREHIAVARLAVNYHMAPLPEYRGCNQFSFALFEGAKEFGTTVHRLENGVDSGAIIDEIRFPVDSKWDVSELYEATYRHTLNLFRRSIPQLLRRNYSLTPQQDLVASRGSRIYRRKDIERLKQINVDDPVPLIVKKVKATSMPGFEPPYFIHDGEKYYIIPEKHLPGK